MPHAPSKKCDNAMQNNATVPGLLARLRQLLLTWADFAQVLQAQTTVRTRDEVERIIILSLLGESCGVPFLPAPLRLLPYFVPKIYQWRRQQAPWADFSADTQGGC